ncbi:MAG: hypothetical protein ACSHXL_06110 [Bacteroidota bacterium]
MRVVILSCFLLFTNQLCAQIEFSYFKDEIDRLKTDRKVEKYWRELYKFDRDNTSLKIPMDSVTVLNRLKAAYLIQQYGFPTQERFGKRAVYTLLSIHAHNRLTDVGARTFFQLKEGKNSEVWNNGYPNYAMTNMLFWYNGNEVVLDQEFALALRTLEEQGEKKLDMEQLCAVSSSFLYMQRARRAKVIGEWVMSFSDGKVPLQIIQIDTRYYLKRGDYYYLLTKDDSKVYHFYTELDKTSLFIFENGELVFRDMYGREMGVYPKKN